MMIWWASGAAVAASVMVFFGSFIWGVMYWADKSEKGQFQAKTELPVFLAATTHSLLAAIAVLLWFIAKQLAAP